MTPRLPFARSHPLQTPAQLRALRERGGVHRVRTRVGHDAWLVTGYEEARRLLSDDRLGRAHPDPGNAARTGESALFGGPLGDFETEATDHARMRAMLQPQFSPRRMRAFRPRVEALTAELLDRLGRLRPPADLHRELALPLPILVICELLGVPYEDRDHFRAWADAAADVTDRARSEKGLADLFGYGRQLVDRRRGRPGDDFVSRLLADGVPEDEVAMMAMLMLFAGHETTVVAIGLGALSLLAEPAQWRALAEDPSLIPGAVEELLRWPGKGGGGIPRYARADIELDGVTIRAGELVLLDNGSANHDPAAFPDPDRLDVTRQAAHHLTFGHGLRYCLGAPLARIELQAVFTRLVPRFPTMRLAVPVEELRLHDTKLTGGLVELPVEW
ncbi:cytochrome P450 [Thermoactinospora rubra]|uniref:cytochrome P450 n=1 Tax=Thermoactinospora rubra TaxID=1088767 RepID=UPI001F0AE6DF|nr:cytochrome P450 [Thermoactinospora rubra]